MQNGRFPTGRRGKYKQRQKKSDTLCPLPGPGVVNRAEGINVSANIVYVIQGELYTQERGEILGHLPVVLKLRYTVCKCIRTAGASAFHAGAPQRARKPH